MTERRRQMPVLDRRVQHRRVVRPDRGDEVRKVIAPALPLLLLHAVAVDEVRPGVRVGDPHRAALAVHEVADRHALVLVHLPLVGLCRLVTRKTAHLEDQRRAPALEDRDLRVGRVAVIDVAKATADRPDGVWHAVGAERPTGDVHLVDALIAEIAVARVQVPVPVVVQAPASQRFVCDRPEPAVVVDGRGDELRAVHPTDRSARLVAETTRTVDLAEPTAVDEVDRATDRGGRASLRARRAEPAAPLRGLDDPRPFLDDVRHRLLDVDVLARFKRPAREHRVRMVGRRDRDDVDVVPIEERADVAGRLDLEAGSVLVALRTLSGAVGEHLRVDVAQGDDPAAGLRRETLDVVPSATSNADDRDPQVGRRSLDAGRLLTILHGRPRGVHAGRHHRRGGGTGGKGEKVTSAGARMSAHAPTVPNAGPVTRRRRRIRINRRPRSARRIAREASRPPRRRPAR